VKGFGLIVDCLAVSLFVFNLKTLADFHVIWTSVLFRPCALHFGVIGVPRARPKEEIIHNVMLIVSNALRTNISVFVLYHLKEYFVDMVLAKYLGEDII